MIRYRDQRTGRYIAFDPDAGSTRSVGPYPGRPRPAVLNWSYGPILLVLGGAVILGLLISLLIWMQRPASVAISEQTTDAGVIETGTGAALAPRTASVHAEISAGPVSSGTRPPAHLGVPLAPVASSKPSSPSKSSQPGGTVSQQNALRSAKSYIEMSGFSRQGLIDQLSSQYGEGFPVADATWAVDQLSVDWNEQAVRAGRSYLSMSGFSRARLIDQLSSPYGDKFTVAQATYAADHLGLTAEPGPAPPTTNPTTTTTTTTTTSTAPPSTLESQTVAA
jgi:hypothetical protein